MKSRLPVIQKAVIARLIATTLLLLMVAKMAAACMPIAAPSTPPTEASSAGDAMPAAAETGDPAFDVQGHRGARGLKPENTLPAFETALDLGVDTLELDLHFSADDVVVVWHDETIDAAKCGLDPSVADPAAPDPESASPLDLRIRQLTLAQLQEYRCDRNPDPDAFPDQDAEPTTLAGDDFSIPTLAEVFTFVESYANSEQKSEVQRQAARQVRFNVETKRQPDKSWAIGDDFDGENPGAFETSIVSLIEEHGLVDRTVVQSFDHRSIWAVRQLNPQIELAALTNRPLNMAVIAEQGATILSPRASILTPSLLDEAHELGLKVIPWTVNDPEEMQRLIDMGVDGIITDRPDLLLALEPK